MTYQDLLDALRIAEPLYPEADDSTRITQGYTQSTELLNRLSFTKLKQVHREWSPLELMTFFTDANYNLDKVIPCRHCSPVSQRNTM